MVNIKTSAYDLNYKEGECHMLIEEIIRLIRQHTSVDSEAVELVVGVKLNYI
jgi:hypothetical protein